MAKKHRLPTKLIEIENGTKKYMPLSHAMKAVDQKRATIVDGKVRFAKAAGDSGEYSDDTGAATFQWGGKLSAGFNVLQARKRFPAGYANA